jgi:hypothetical protein
VAALREIDEAISIERRIGRPLQLAHRLRSKAAIEKSRGSQGQEGFDEAVRILREVGLEELASEWEDAWARE